MEEDLTKDEFKNEITTLDKEEKPINKKKLIIGISIGALCLFILAIIIIIRAMASTDSPKPKIGEINCIFDIQTTSENTKIFGTEFTKNSAFDIIIDGKKIDYKKEYKFESMGEQ